MEVKCPVCGTKFVTGTTCNCATRVEKENAIVEKKVFTIEDLTKAVENFIEGNVTTDDGNGFAKTSKYYNKALASGNIYNPYTVRRWLPPEFLGLMKRYNNKIYKAVRKEYDWKYVIRWLRTECEKLDRLSKHDHTSYVERSSFLTPLMVNQILTDYVAATNRYLNLLIAKTETNKKKDVIIKIPYFKSYYVGTRKEFVLNHKVCSSIEPSSDWIVLQAELNKLTKRGLSYKDYAKMLNAFEIIPTIGTVCDAFVHPFVKQGAFYTLKNLIEFEDVKFVSDDWRCFDANESIQALYKVRGLESYKLYAILKKSIECNRYRF